MPSKRWLIVGAGLLSVFNGTPLGAQELSDFDYENLSFRGLGLAVGAILPNRVENSVTFGTRLDLGYLGPGVRVTPTVTYWSADFESGEVTRFEDQLLRLINRNLAPGEQLTDVDLDVISWTDVALGLDAHVVWALPSVGMLTYAGGGIAAHILNGEGAAIGDTFVEDLLDRVAAGANAHLGLEVPVTPQLRVYAEGRYELLEDLRYLEFRTGIQIMVRPTVPAELGG